ncbi:hypothetical protein [Amnibacterium endophyticum]|uniref:DUF3093 domain-containing protein n=1 Tax=Amnibacterium endophyticum TaxID=2109337 RepID=A0ABW4LBD9_9MICO
MNVGHLVRSAVIGLPAAVLIGLAAWIIGLDGPHAIALGAGVLAVVLVLLAQRSVVSTEDLAPDGPEPRTGGRSDLQQLAWSIVEHRSHIRGTVVARLRRVAAHRLAPHGLVEHRSEDADAIAALLGADAWAVLRPGREKAVPPRAFAAALTAVERLPPPAPGRLARPLPDDRTSRAD